MFMPQKGIGINSLINWILKKEKIKTWIEKQTDSAMEKPVMSYKIMTGIALIAFSFVVQYVGIIVSSFLAIYFKAPEIAAIAIPLLYSLSWIIWLLGMFLLGKVNYEYVKYRLAIYLKNKYQADITSV